MKTDVPLQLRYGGLVMLCLGPALILLGGGGFLAARSAQDWPTAEVRVVRSKVAVSKKAAGFSRSRTTMSDYFTATVKYEYTVDGKQYTSDRIQRTCNPSGFDRSEIAQWTRKYPQGADITIHYSPRKPSLAVIDPTPDVLGLSLLLGGGLIMIPVGLVLIRVARHLQPADSKDTAETRPTPIPAQPPRTMDHGSPSPTPRPTTAPLPTQPVSATRHSPVTPSPVTLPGPVPVPRQMHFLLRTLAVLVGLSFFFLGALALPKSAELCFQAVRTPSADPAATIASFITTMIVGSMALVGAFLICKGTKNNRRVLAR